MRVVQLDPRMMLHPKLFGLPAGPFKEYIECWFYLAEHPEVDFIPARYVTLRHARELVNRQLLAQDGGAFRLIDDDLRAPNHASLPQIAHGVDLDLEVRVEDLAPKPESSKALALEGKSLGAFERFWKAFGLKVDRKKAQIAFAKAIKTTDPDVIIDAAAAHNAWFENYPGEPPKRKYAQGWLTARRWEDELPPYPTGNGLVVRKRDDFAGRALREAALRGDVP